MMRSSLCFAVVAATIALAAGPASAAAPKTLTATAGSVSATVTWNQEDFGASDVHVTIERNGEVGIDTTLQDADGRPVADTPVALTARDLDGDAEPELLLDLYTNGAHCCTYTLLYHYGTVAGPAYETLVQQWGNVGYRLVDLDHDGLPELRSGDDRFNYAFTCYACSGVPVQIWQFRGGDFVPELQEVTRLFPSTIAKDRKLWWKTIQRERKRADHDIRGVVAAWAADGYLLGDHDAVDRKLERLRRAGELTVHDGGIWPSGRKYVRELKKLLRELGYLKLPA